MKGRPAALLDTPGEPGRIAPGLAPGGRLSGIFQGSGSAVCGGSARYNDHLPIVGASALCRPAGGVLTLSGRFVVRSLPSLVSAQVALPQSLPDFAAPIEITHRFSAARLAGIWGSIRTDPIRALPTPRMEGGLEASRLRGAIGGRPVPAGTSPSLKEYGQLVKRTRSSKWTFVQRFVAFVCLTCSGLVRLVCG